MMKRHTVITTATNNIEYRVQLMALSKRISKIGLAKKYNLDKTIKEDIYNDYYIYTVGPFLTYEDAKKIPAMSSAQ